MSLIIKKFEFDYKNNLAIKNPIYLIYIIIIKVSQSLLETKFNSNNASSLLTVFTNLLLNFFL